MPATSCASLRIRYRRLVASWALGNICLPASVNVAPCGVRMNSSTPIQFSSDRTLRLKAGWVTWRASAARTKLPYSANAAKSSSQTSSKGNAS
ncbi:hypothetical protein D3C87_2014010 [compost metagenome]